MRMLLPAALAAAFAFVGALPAEAGGGHRHGWHSGYHTYGGYHGGHYKHRHSKRHHYAYRHHRRHHHHHRRHGDEILLGAGIIGGAVIVGSVLAQPRYAPPPPTVYTYPPPQPACVQDQVYRYLPDGSIQWGTRTRCY